MHSKNIMALELNFRRFEILSGKAVLKDTSKKYRPIILLL